MTWIYLSNGRGRVRTNDADVAAALERSGFRRCSQHEYQLVGRWLRRIKNLPKPDATEGAKEKAMLETEVDEGATVS